MTADVIADTLRPVWRSKPEAAKKAIARLRIVLNWAQARVALGLPRGWATEQIENARTQLGPQMQTVQHIPSMPWPDVPAFYARLGEDPSNLALRLLILTASRSRPVRLAHVDQFDGDVWTIPAENMKTGGAFRVPLTEEAQRVVEIARPVDGFLFTGPRGKPLSDPAMIRAMQRRKLPYRPHGFRSSFRDWAAESGHDWTLAELSLDHVVGSKASRAYQRSDLLEQRRPLMLAWSDVLLG